MSAVLPTIQNLKSQEQIMKGELHSQLASAKICRHVVDRVPKSVRALAKLRRPIGTMRLFRTKTTEYGVSDNPGEMGAESGGPLPPLSAPFAPALDRGPTTIPPLEQMSCGSSKIS